MDFLLRKQNIISRGIFAFIGVPKTMELVVINESEVDVGGTIKISSDGPEISSITLDDYAVADKPKPKVPQWPKEFNIEPSKIYIESESRVTVKVFIKTYLFFLQTVLLNSHIYIYIDKLYKVICTFVLGCTDS